MARQYFGTDGIRGLANTSPMTSEIALKVGMAAGKQFWNINDPHVVYYQNPKGLSTRPDTRGVVEAMDIHKTYCRKIIPREMVAPTEEFRRILGPVLHAAGEGQDRYAMAHDALRNLGRTARFGRGREVRA